MKIEYIYWFANFNNFSPSVRYRGIYPLELLRAKYNVNSTFIYPSYKLLNILKFIATVVEILFFRKKNSLVVIENVYTRRIYALVLKTIVKINNKNTLYDIDDAEYERFTDTNIKYFIKHVSACSVGSRTLEEYSKKLNNDVFLLTSPIIQHEIVKVKKNKVLTIGWIGFYAAHQSSLYKDFFPALTMIDIPIKLIILGIRDNKDEINLRNYYSTYPNITIEIPRNLDWQNEIGIYEYISKFDIGISTLLDNEFNRAKSAFKLKQYMSCGVPVLGSSLGENNFFLIDGVNGYICNNPSEYKNKILEVNALSESEYTKMSIKARASYYHFNIDNYCKTLLQHYKDL